MIYLENLLILNFHFCDSDQIIGNRRKLKITFSSLYLTVDISETDGHERKTAALSAHPILPNVNYVSAKLCLPHEYDDLVTKTVVNSTVWYVEWKVVHYLHQRFQLDQDNS